MTFNIIKSIDILSHQNGKRYSSTRQYERDLQQAGCNVMSDKSFKEMRERLYDERHSVPKTSQPHNHVHIDLRNGNVTTSRKDLGE